MDFNSANLDSNATSNARSRRSWHNSGHDPQKRYRSVVQPEYPHDARYERQALPVPMEYPQISHTFYEPMALPSYALNAYFANDASIQNQNPEYIKHGWELFRSIPFYQALTTIPLEDFLVGQSYLSSGLVPFYGKIHQDHLPHHSPRRPAVDSGYYSQRDSIPEPDRSSGVPSSASTSWNHSSLPQNFQPHSYHGSESSVPGMYPSQGPHELARASDQFYPNPSQGPQPQMSYGPGLSLPEIFTTQGSHELGRGVINGFYPDPSHSSQPQPQVYGGPELPLTETLATQGAHDLGGPSNQSYPAQSTEMNWTMPSTDLTTSSQMLDHLLAPPSSYSTNIPGRLENARISNYEIANPVLSTVPGPSCLGSDTTPTVPSIAPPTPGRARYLRLPVNTNRSATFQSREARVEKGSPSAMSRHKFECTYCSERFAEDGYRNQHERQKHDLLMTFTCLHEECHPEDEKKRKVYTSEKEGLLKHRRNSHKQCLDNSCEKCLVGERVIIRHPKRAAACGVCGAIFRKSRDPMRQPRDILMERAEHIRSHYSDKIQDVEYLFSWKKNHWKKSKIVKAFLREPEIHRYWADYKSQMARKTPGFKFDYNWDNCSEKQWDEFIYLAEFGGDHYKAAAEYFSSTHVQAIVEMAYSLAQESPREPGKPTPDSSRTHTRSSSNEEVDLSNTIQSVPYRQHGLPVVGSQDVNGRDLALRLAEFSDKMTGSSSGSIRLRQGTAHSFQSVGQTKRVDIDPTNHITQSTQANIYMDANGYTDSVEHTAFNENTHSSEYLDSSEQINELLQHEDFMEFSEDDAASEHDESDVENVEQDYEPATVTEENIPKKKSYIRNKLTRKKGNRGKR